MDTKDTTDLRGSFVIDSCRVVQKALESLDDDEIPQLLIEFHHNVLSCIYDQNGNHVIQKSIEVVGKKAKEARARGDEAKCKAFEKEIDFIFDDVMNNARSLSCHPYGCRVLQRILEHYPEPKKSHVLDVIQKFHRPLLDDQFGNYVIQHVLQFGRSTDRDLLLDIIIENGLLILSRQKFASNVVEKLLKYGNTQQHSRVIHEMLKVRTSKHQELTLCDKLSSPILNCALCLWLDCRRKDRGGDKRRSSWNECSAPHGSRSIC